MALNTITPEVLAYKPPHPKLEEFVPDRDRALFADPTKAALFANASAVEEVTPYIGTELKGLQLSKLTDAQKDELALLVAEVCGLEQLLTQWPDSIDETGREVWCSSAIKISRSISSMSLHRTMAK